MKKMIYQDLEGIIAKDTMLYKLANKIWKIIWWVKTLTLIILYLFIIQIKKILGIYDGGQ